MWDDTMSGTSCGWTNLEGQSGACAGSCDDVRSYAQNTVRIWTECGQTTKQTSTDNKRKIDTKPRKHRHKIDRKQAGISRS